MLVFLSWSKPRSQQVAAALKDWLPDVLQEVDPWMSKMDIAAGERWSQEIAGKLEEVSFGICCVTPENVHEPWINFEAGACAKRVKESRLVPYLFEMKPTDVTGPLSQFQMKVATKQGTLELVEALNRALGEKALSQERLTRAFDRNWPALEEALSKVQPEESDRTPKRDQREILEEVLQHVRNIDRSQKRFPEEVRSVMRSQRPRLGSVAGLSLGSSNFAQRLLDLEDVAKPIASERFRREARALGIVLDDSDKKGNEDDSE